jgi:hypothetical protein
MHRFAAPQNAAQQGASFGPRRSNAAPQTGRPLDAASRTLMESRFGHDFSGVRVHTDPPAADAARAFAARAYTVGNDIYFGAGQFRPGTREGDRLLAHELVHTLQRVPSGGVSLQPKLDVSTTSDPAEREADAVSRSVMDGSRPSGGGPVAVVADRKTISREDLKTNAGVFKVENYNETDGDPGKDTEKAVGAEIDIEFTPDKTVKSDKINFVQIQKALKNGTPYLFENEKPRATEAKDKEAGWAVDRVAGKKSPNYAQNDDKTAGGNTKFGYRKSDTDFKPAWMHDGPSLNRTSKGMTVSIDFTAFVLDSTNSKYLGALAWGFATNAGGTTTKKKAAVHAMGDPGGIQKRALERWNEQAVNPDASKRNAPDQEKVPVPK